jgi:adenine phosphoribosyltransferase
MDYALEYGNASVELHEDAVRPGQRVLLVDDLVATGGTMLAAISLLQQLGSNLIEATAVVNLPELGGSDAIIATGTPFYSLCDFEGD